MRIIILGAGRVGTSLAGNLVKENNDVILIDKNAEQLEKIKNHFDIQTITGLASSPTVLIEAGIQNTDLLIAVTDYDDTNMLACYIAQRLFSVPKTIARIKSEDYYNHPKLFSKTNIPINIVINPESLITDYIIRIIQYPGIAELLYFSDDKTCLLTIETQRTDWLNGKTVAELQDKIHNINTSVVAIFSKKKSVPIQGNYVLGPKDKILFMAQKHTINKILEAVDHHQRPNKRITIGGGGRIGSKLSQAIQKKYKVKLMEVNPVTAAALADTLNNVIVLEGDIAERELLLQENIQDMDVFCAVTNDDETNIMACLQAKSLGTRYTIALVNREGYADLVDESPIDYAVLPQIQTIGNILSKLKRGNMIKVHRLQEHEAEAIELVVEGTSKTSAVIGRFVNDIEFPPDCIVLGVLRGSTLHLNMAKLKIMPKDHVILLLLNKKYIQQLETLFQVNLDFLS